MRVLVVDDSITFRSQIKRALATLPGVEVVGTASNGKIALQLIEQTRVELVTLDLNMPQMDGLEVLERLGAAGGGGPRVIVFAGRSPRSSSDTVKALALGAVDFVVKPEAAQMNFENAYLEIAKELVPKVQQFLDREPRELPTKPEPARRRSFADARPEAVVVASSTGGPAALERLVSRLPLPLTIPVLIAQHMPPQFTHFLAERLAVVSGVECAEAKDGEPLRAGKIYIAPGDYHLRVVTRGKIPHLALDQGPKVHSVRPAADHLFESAAAHFGPTLAAFILTGMGEDGVAGARVVRRAGGVVMLQDRETSVVWGMPGAAYQADAYDAVGSIDECATMFGRFASRGKVSA